MTLTQVAFLPNGSLLSKEINNGIVRGKIITAKDSITNELQDVLRFVIYLLYI